MSFFLKKDVNFQNAVLCTRQDFLADRCIAKVCCIVCGTMQKDIHIYIFFFIIFLLLLLFGSKPLGNIHNDGRLASLGCEMFINK